MSLELDLYYDSFSDPKTADDRRREADARTAHQATVAEAVRLAGVRAGSLLETGGDDDQEWRDK